MAGKAVCVMGGAYLEVILGGTHLGVLGWSGYKKASDV